MNFAMFTSKNREWGLLGSFVTLPYSGLRFPVVKNESLDGRDKKLSADPSSILEWSLLNLSGAFGEVLMRFDANFDTNLWKTVVAA